MHTLWAWPMSKRSALSVELARGDLTSMMVSLPPDMTSPSGCDLLGGEKVRELTYSDPRLTRAPSNDGGEPAPRRHMRTVQSLEAERTVSGEGKLTARTCPGLASMVLRLGI